MTGEAKAADVTPSSLAALPGTGGSLAAWIVLATGIALSLAAWLFAQSVVEREARSKFHLAALAFEAAANTRMRSYTDLLFGVQGLFQAHPETSRADFDNYVYALDLPVRFPGVRAISYARRVPAAEKAAFAEQLRRDPELIRRGYANAHINPAGEHAEHFVITYIEPLHYNKRALGFDIASDPKRIALVERARDTGMPAMSGPVALAANPDDSEIGLVMRLALYGRNAFTPDVKRRREAFVGLANVTFVANELALYMLSARGHEPFTLTIVDTGFVDSDPEPMRIDLYSNVALRAPQTGPSFQESVYVDVGQRRWELKIGAPQELFFRPADHATPWIALASVLALSLLLSGLIQSLAGSRGRAHALAKRMTADMLESQAKLGEEQRRTQELLEALPNPVYFKGTDGRYLGVNKAWEAYFGVPRQAFVGKTVSDLYPDDPETARRLEADDRALWNAPGTRSYETTITTADGKAHEAIYYKAAFSDAGGNTAGLIGTIVDITERKQAERRLHEREAELSFFKYTLDQARDCIFMFRTEDYRFVYVNQGAQQQVGYTEAELLAMSPPDIKPEYTRERFRTLTQPLLDGTQTSIKFETIHRHKDGHDIPVEVVMQFIAQTAAERCFVAIVRDITERKLAEERIRYLAHYDELTGLANRNTFSVSLNHALARARRDDQQLAILFLDLDRFKNINDTFGHDAGDRVLREMGQRLRSCLRESDTLCRFGGDEFVVLLEAMPHPGHSAVVARKLLAAAAKPFSVEGQQFQITTSIGISTYPSDSDDPQTLLKNADVAMYRAKEQGKNNYQFYLTQMNVHTRERMALESDLRVALERDEFVLHYQPKIALASGRIVGMEALVRWQHPTDGLIQPAKFIPLAEETGLIVAIGEWVLKAACAQSRSWREQGLPPLRIAVNLSPRQFAHEELLQDVDRRLSENGLDSAALELEVTESVVMQEPERAAILLGRLKIAGVIVAIDDFGTGYSSLSYLKRFPIDSLKVDRSFIKDLPLDAEDAAITKAIIVMAHNLGLKVIAEGVETEEQVEFLLANGCDEAQGYYFSKPVPAHEFASLVLNGAGPKAPQRAMSRT